MKRAKLLAALMALLLLSSLAACNKEAKVEGDIYTLSIDLTGDALALYEQISHTAKQTSERLTLRLYANAFDEDNDVIRVLSVKINGQTSDFEISPNDPTTLYARCEISAGTRYLITVAAEIDLPEDSGGTRLSKCDGSINLALFYPALAVNEEGGFAKFGDPYFSETANFYVAASFDKNYAVASSGRITSEVIDGDKKTVEIEAENIREFAMTLAPFEIANKSVALKSKSVDVKYCYLSDKTPEVTLERICSAVEVFSDAFGEYAYDALTVAEGKLREGGGIEYGSFALLSDNADLLDVATHEVAHQWWYGAVGSDQINSAWLDEGLAEFCSCYYHLLIGDKPSYDAAIAELDRYYDAFASLKGFDGIMTKPLGGYLTEGEYVALNYVKGALMFESLFIVVGERKFQAAMRLYYKQNLFKIADAKALCAAFEAQGYKIDKFLSSWLNGKVIV